MAFSRGVIVILAEIFQQAAEDCQEIQKKNEDFSIF
jgi:hypothetical protein